MKIFQSMMLPNPLLQMFCQFGIELHGIPAQLKHNVARKIKPFSKNGQNSRKIGRTKKEIRQVRTERAEMERRFEETL